MAISKYNTPMQNTLEEYVPLPLQTMMQAAQAIQQRGDLADQMQTQTETGLASLEALAPGYQQVRNKLASDYRTKVSEALDKYQGNTSNPEFVRELKRINTAITTDPRLQTIQQGNAWIKDQQKRQMDLDEKGVKYINPLKNFTGIDDKGNLIVPSSTIRATNFDEEIHKSFADIRDNMVNDGRGHESNKPNLDNMAKNWIHNLDSNPTTRDAIQWYKDQGFNDQQARAKTLDLVNQAYTSNLRNKRDFTYDQLVLTREKMKNDVANEMWDRNYKMLLLGIQQQKANNGTKKPPTTADILKQQVVNNGNKSINTVINDKNGRAVTKILTTHTSTRKVGDKMAPRTLRDAFIVDTEGKVSRASRNVEAQPTQDVLVYLDDRGNLVTGDVKKAGSFNPNRKTYTVAGKTIHVKPVAAREYRDAQGNRYYEPLNYTETVLSGFNPSENVDFRPLFDMPKPGTKGKITMNPTLLQNLDHMSRATGGQGLKGEGEFQGLLSLANKYNSGKGLTRAEYNKLRNYNNNLTSMAYDYVNQSSIYPYLEGKPAQNSIAKQFMSPFDNSMNDMTAKQVEESENE